MTPVAVFDLLCATLSPNKAFVAFVPAHLGSVIYNYGAEGMLAFVRKHASYIARATWEEDAPWIHLVAPAPGGSWFHPTAWEKVYSDAGDDAARQYCHWQRINHRAAEAWFDALIQPELRVQAARRLGVHYPPLSTSGSDT